MHKPHLCTSLSRVEACILQPPVAHKPVACISRASTQDPQSARSVACVSPVSTRNRTGKRLLHGYDWRRIKSPNSTVQVLAFVPVCDDCVKSGVLGGGGGGLLGAYKPCLGRVHVI